MLTSAFPAPVRSQKDGPVKQIARPTVGGRSWFFAAAAVLALAACGDGSTGLVQDGVISVSPNEVTFSGVVLGQDLAPQTLFIANEGAGDLTIDSITVSANTNDITLCEPFTSAVVAPGEEVIVRVCYSPTQAIQAAGDVVIVSNDRTRPTLPVPIRTPPLRPFPVVEPTIIDFGRVFERTESTVTVTVFNRGTAPLTIDEMFLTGSADYSAPDLDDIDFPLTIPVSGVGEAAESIQFDIQYAPPSPGADDGNLVIVYDGTEEDTTPITGEAGLPALTCAPDPIDFGFAPLGLTTPKTVTCTNTGNLPLEITHVYLASTSSPEYALGNLPTELRVPEGSLVLPPESSLPFLVNFTPDRETSYGGEVIIEQAGGSETTILVTGVGTNNRCPLAVASAFIREDPQQRRSNQIDWATPTNTLILDAGRSSDADGSVEAYEWSIVSSPEGTTTELRPLSSDPENDALRQFFIPLSGRYEFLLRVYDDLGFPDCDTPATVTVISIPDETIHIELTWNNPLDNDQSDDQGSDVDLHFVKVGHNWFDQTFDTYYANQAPTWSPELPSLDIDDTDGAGPENIQMDNPLDCQWYAIGVHYFERQFGTAYATIRVYVDTEQIAEIVNRPLQDVDDFWDVGRLHWPSGQFFAIDEIYDNFDGSSATPPGITPDMAAAVAGGGCP